MLPSSIAVRVPSLLLGSALVLAVPAQGQRLVGHVLEEGTTQPVVAAEIAIVDSTGTELNSTVTDSTGWFQFGLRAVGRYRLRVSHIAFAAWESDAIELRRGETVEIEVRVGRTVIPLEPLVVTARSSEIGRLGEFRARVERNPFGRFLQREDIERRGAFRVTDLLQATSGLRIEYVQRGPATANLITMRGGATGRCSPNIYIDGVRVGQSTEFPIDDLLVPEMLEGVEIYSSTGGAPPQYQLDPTCGVVLFWTRQGEGGRPFSWKRLLIGAGAAALIIFFAR